MKRIMEIGPPLAVVAFLFASALASPNLNSDFSGTWHMDLKRSQSSHFGEPVVPTILVIKQTPTLLTIETKQGSQRELLTYKLDGTQSTVEPQANGPLNWRAQWDEGKLVTETTRNVHGSAIVVKEIRTLALNGKEMTIDRTLTVQHGYGSGNNSSTARDVFIKAL